MWLLLFMSVPLLAGALAAWGIWRRKWIAVLPAVVVGLWSFLPAGISDAIDDVDDRVILFATHVAPEGLVMAGLLVDAAAVACLTALWAGWSRVHWCWRLSALAGVPAALSLVRANEPIVLAFAVMPLLAGVAWWLRQSRDRHKAAADWAPRDKSPFRWQIRDALLLFIVVGLVALALRSVIAGPFYMNWKHFGTLAIALDLLALAAAAAVTAPTGWKRIACAIGGIGLMAGVAAAFISTNNDVLGLAYFFEQPYIEHVGSGLFLISAVGIPLAIGLASGVYAWRGRAAGAGRSTRLPTAILALLAAALLGPLLVAGWLMLPPRINVEPLSPSPTYDRLIAAGDRLRRLVPTGRTAAQLRPEISAVEEILQTPGHVYFDPEVFAARELSRQYDLSFDAIQHVSIALEIEMARAEARGDYARSTHLAELQFKLADSTSHGGLMMNWVLARRAQSYGRAALDDAAPHLPRDELARRLAQVQAHGPKRPTVDAAIAYNEYWHWVAFGWRDRFYRAAQRLVGDRRLWLQLDEPRLRAWDTKEIAAWRLLETRLALELFRRDRGAYPDRLEELVPDYVPRVPLDPFTGRPLIYRRKEAKFVLYSTGPDRQDDGGTFTHQVGTFAWEKPGYDLDAGFDRRDGIWPRDDAALMGIPTGAIAPAPASPTPPAANAEGTP